MLRSDSKAHQDRYLPHSLWRRPRSVFATPLEHPLIPTLRTGIGFGIITALVKRPNVYIYAGARSPSTATQLNELASAHPGVLEVVQLASASVPDAEAIAKLIEAKFGKLDVIIANAGWSLSLRRASSRVLTFA